jgi:hypothetical protein
MLLLFSLKLSDCTHEANEHLDEMLPAKPFHRPTSLGPEHLVRDFDQLWMDVEPVEPTVLAMAMPWFVGQVHLVFTVFQEDVTHREVLPTKSLKQALGYLG